MIFGEGIVKSKIKLSKMDHVHNKHKYAYAYSGSTWTSILIQAEHLFWFNLNTDSGFKLNTFLGFSRIGVQVARMGADFI